MQVLNVARGGHAGRRRGAAPGRRLGPLGPACALAVIDDAAVPEHPGTRSRVAPGSRLAAALGTESALGQLVPPPGARPARRRRRADRVGRRRRGRGGRARGRRVGARRRSGSCRRAGRTTSASSPCSPTSSARQLVQEPAQQPHEAAGRRDVEPLARRVRPLDLAGRRRSASMPGRLAAMIAASSPPWVSVDLAARAPNSRSWTRPRGREHRRRPGPAASPGRRCRPRSPRRRAARRRRSAPSTSGSSASFALRLTASPARSCVAVGLGAAERRARLDDAREVGAHRRAGRPAARRRGRGSARCRPRVQASRRAPSGRRDRDAQPGVGRAVRVARSPPASASIAARARVAGDHDARSRRAGSRCGSRRRRTTRSAARARAQRAGQQP